MIEPSLDTKIFTVNTGKRIGSERGLLINPNQYAGNGKGRGNRGRGRNNTKEAKYSPTNFVLNAV